MTDDPKPTSTPKRPPTGTRDVSEFLDEREMDETLDETFPASDAPSWTLGVDEDRREQPPAAGKAADLKREKSRG